MNERRRSAFERVAEGFVQPKLFTVDDYMRRYAKVYDPVANAKAEAEKAEIRARRNALNAKSACR